MPDQVPAQIAPGNRLLTAAEFHRLADVPPEVEWFANLTNNKPRWRTLVPKMTNPATRWHHFNRLFFLIK